MPVLSIRFYITEVEQVNQERADYYRETLPQEVYDQLKELVERRKQVPYACARHLATECKHEHSYLVSNSFLMGEIDETGAINSFQQTLFI